jgi:hypothetical protein
LSRLAWALQSSLRRWKRRLGLRVRARSHLDQ